MSRLPHRNDFRGVRPRRISTWGLGLFLLALLTRGAAAQPDPNAVLPAVVTCEYLDARGLSLRTSSGVLMQDGLLLPYSALLDVTMVEAHARDGRSWSSNRLIALHPEADLALLQIDDVPSYALTAPRDLALPAGQEIVLVRGPGGPGPNSKTTTLYGKFRLNGPDFIAIPEGHEDGAAAFRVDGVLLGICFDLSEQGYSLAYLVSAASVSNLLKSQGPAVLVNSIVPPVPPEYKVRTNAIGLAFRGAILQTAQKTADARTFLELALKKDPNLAPAHFWMGKVQFAEQRFDQAAASFEKAGQLAGNYHFAWHMAGASYNQAGNYPKALEMYRKALEIDPRSALTWCNLGGTEFNRQNFPEAEAAFAKAIGFDPSYGLAYFNLGVLQQRTGRKQDAEKTYEILLRKDAAWAQRLRGALDAN